MPKSAVNLLAVLGALGAIAAALLVAFSAKTAVRHAMGPPQSGATITVMIEIVDPGTKDADKPQDINISEFIVSDSVLFPAAEALTYAFPDLTLEEIADVMRSHLTVTPDQNVFRIDCSLDTRQVAQQVLQEMANNIPYTLDAALWPNGKRQREKFDLLSKSKDKSINQLSRLKKEYADLLQRTPVIIHDGGAPELPKVLTDKRAELESAEEEFEAAIAALANQQLKPNYSLRFRVIRGPTESHMAK